MRRVTRWKVGLLVGPALCVIAAMAVVGGAEPPASPQPVVAWPAGPFEVRVAFNQPLDPAVAAKAVGRVIPFEDEESIIQQANPKKKKPRPSRVVSTLAQRGMLRIAGAWLADDDRTLVLVTDPHPRVATYSLHLSSIRGPGAPLPGEAIDLMYGLGGVEASWYADGSDEQPAWTGWWPDLDPGLVRQLTVGSLMHARSLELMSRPGRLVLNTLFVLPKGQATLRLVSNRKIEAQVGGEDAVAADEPEGGQKVEHPVDSTGEPFDLTVTLPTGVDGKRTTFKAGYSRGENPKDVRLAHERLLLPWAATNPPIPKGLPLLPAGMTGGDPVRGEAIFYSAQARCSACHSVGGKGGNVGPELGHQFERPLAEVYRDIADPGIWIDPQYVAYTVALKDGRVLVGVVRADGPDAIRVSDTDAKTTIVPRAQIADLRPSSTSIMPVGVVGALGEVSVRDLMAFLTQEPGSGSR
jgi:putative heme-binding domain-containing protein